MKKAESRNLDRVIFKILIFDGALMVDLGNQRVVCSCIGTWQPTG